VLLSREWHIAVLDEAQTIKNPNAATTRWLRGIKARHRFCLTGTPMENHLGELWSIMTFANPGHLGDKANFARQWRTPIEKRGDTARAAALAQRVKPFLLRRTKEEVAPELPPKSEIIESVVLEGSQRDLYDSIRLSMSEKVRRASGNAAWRRATSSFRSLAEIAPGLLPPGASSSTTASNTRRQAGPADGDGAGTAERDARSSCFRSSPPCLP
jgi:SNF2 family DNA or RNA helicase